MRIPRNSKLLCLLISLSIIPPLILILGLLSYLNESMRVCLPFSIERISLTAHRKLSCQPPYLNQIRPYSNTTRTSNSIMADIDSAKVNGNGIHEGKLAGFLKSQKETFLEDLGKGNAKGWTVVMGNEAGDLDSVASSIANAYLSTILDAKRSIPLILTPSKLMSLRPENLLALKLSSIPLDSLLHIDQLPLSLSTPSELSSNGVEFALVDHNKLLPIFDSENIKVNSIIDHHQDENSHLDAEIREITVPTGSCASLVTKHFKQSWINTLKGGAGKNGSPIPPELSTLLLSSILIDTTGLKPDRKATHNDYQSADFLYPLSTLWSGKDITENINGNGNDNIVNFAEDGSNIPTDLKTLTEELQNTKSDISNLSTFNLLLRDYKEYLLPTSSSDYPTLKIGLSTVPLGLKKWLKKESNGFESLLAEVDEYMIEKNLDIEGILTTFANSQGKHKRELAIIVRSGGVIKTPEQANKVLSELRQGLEQSVDILGLEKWNKDDKSATKSSWESHGDSLYIWKQGNSKSTRKQLAPLLRDLVAGLQ